VNLNLATSWLIRCRLTESLPGLENVSLASLQLVDGELPGAVGYIPDTPNKSGINIDQARFSSLAPLNETDTGLKLCSW